MKKNFILGLAAISMLSFASCETDPAAEKNLASDVVEGIPTTATITLTNAPSTMATESGESNESQIDNATLYVFNNADVLESIVPFSVEDIGAKKVTFQTTTGAKRLFVCANMNNILANFNFKTVTTAANPTAVTKLDAFKKTQAAIANFTSINADNKFWMTNLEAQPAQETVTANGANKFTVSIGRACAKVRLSLGTGVVGSGGTLKNLKFKTKNNPNTMYLMPVYEGANYTGKQLLTPYYGADVQGTYIDGSAQVSFTTTGGVSYLTENSNESIKAGKASYLEVEGIWTPNQDQIVDENGNHTTVGLTGGTFWRIAKYDGDPASGGKIIGYKPYCYNASPKTGVEANQKAIQYQGGKCYYAIYLQDKNAGTDQELKLRYTVKRNTLFDVVISSISGPGANDPGGVVPDPDQPVETVVSMEVSISIAPWTVANLSAGI